MTSIGSDGPNPARQGECDTRLAELERLRRELAQFGDARLTMELVPRTSWYSNVRSHVSPAEWDRLRRLVYQRARSRCQVCGGHGPTHPVQSHEVWDYNDATGVQQLVGLVALCPACHRVKHFGRSHVEGRGDEAIEKLIQVNGWSAERAEAYIELVLEIWRLRSRVPWRLDLSWLAEHGIATPSEAG